MLEKARSADFHATQEPGEIAEQMQETDIDTHSLCEPAQSKCTWTCPKSHPMQEFTGKMPETKIGTHGSREPAQSKGARTSHKSPRIYRKNADEQIEHLDQAPP